jgi:ATP/maltotriose-dependent transcriptional regulator MalT
VHPPLGASRRRQDHPAGRLGRRFDRPGAWLALDESDQDPHQVVRYVTAALQGVAPSCGRAALARLDVPPPPRPEVVLTSVISDLAALPWLASLNRPLAAT